MNALHRQVTAGLLASIVLTASAVIRYVDVKSTNPTPPYTNWAIAANVIQDAVDEALPSDEIVVTNGIYASGGRAVVGSLTNRVAMTKPLILRSANGPEFTIIQGYQVPGTTNGDGAIRCVYLTNGASLTGFTLTNGATRIVGDLNYEQSGGGLWCESSAAVVSNCVFIGNSAGHAGGGSCQATLIDCALNRNSAPGHWTWETEQLPGPGVIIRLVHYEGRGGGTYGGLVRNSTLSGNSADYGGGAYGCRLDSCIIYYNNAFADGDYDVTSTLNHCCVMTQPTNGVGNITSAPLFVDYAGGNLRLEPNSPCINAGDNAHVTVPTDLDGNPRIVGGTVDIGAYEFQSPASTLSYAWLQQFSLPTDGSADFADTDTDGHNNWQEWRADTVPTNALALLTLLAPTNAPSGVAVTWRSVPTRSYFLERGTNLAVLSPVFTPVATNLPGQSGTTTFTDTTATNGGPFFYRVGVQ